MSLSTALQLDTLEDLFVSQIRALYDAEKRLTEALAKVARAATDTKLRAAIESHLAETENHVLRLERVFEILELKPTRQTCEAMKGLLAEMLAALNATGDPDLKDSALIAVVQRVEHHEISCYGTARAIALRLGSMPAAALLQETLGEEYAADEKLTEIAESTIDMSAAKC
jgi:ferritin-like metal-binding protein YciE